MLPWSCASCYEDVGFRFTSKECFQASRQARLSWLHTSRPLAASSWLSPRSLLAALPRLMSSLLSHFSKYIQTLPLPSPAKVPTCVQYLINFYFITHKGSCQKLLSGFCPLRGYPAPYPLNGKSFCQKKTLSGKGGYTPPPPERKIAKKNFKENGSKRAKFSVLWPK